MRSSQTLNTGIKSPSFIPQTPISPSPQNAATNAAPNPSNPPTPAITAPPFAAFVLAGATELEELLLLVCALLVVAGTLVVTATTLVVDAGVEDEVVRTDFEIAPVPEAVVAADAEAREAENLEQRPNPTDAAI